MISNEFQLPTDSNGKDWLSENPETQDDLMTELKNIRLKIETDHSEMVTLEDKIQQKLESYRQKINAIAYGSVITITAQADSKIRIFSKDTHRQPGFVKPGYNFTGTKAEKGQADYTTWLENDQYYVSLDNNRVLYDWDIVIPPETNQ